jgi:hypothetical protein
MFPQREFPEARAELIAALSDLDGDELARHLRGGGRVCECV